MLPLYDNMTRARAREILRLIVPWALESNSLTTIHRANYKGVRGRIGIVGGARDYAGAPYFASISAMRLGADLAYVICSNSAGQAIKNYSPDLIVTPLLDCSSDAEFVNEMDCLLNRLHALVIGPGLGREKLIQSRAKKMIEWAKSRSLPIVLDADSLMLVNEDPSIIKSYPKALLTPNRIEFQRMLNSLYKPKTFDLRGMTTSEIGGLIEQCSKDLDVCILTKGLVDIISSHSTEPFQLVTEESSGSNRRCGGQGDILSGLAGVYLHWIEQSIKQNRIDKIDHPIAWAGYLAAMTTRLSNELAYKEFRNGMLASNMIDKVQVAFESMLQQDDGPYDNATSRSSIKNVNYVGSLTQDEINRYTRQMIMEEFGPERQINLKRSSVLIIGAGGLGCPSAIYLGAGGIGKLGIVDDDRVEESNLHRQILHNLNKVGKLKTESIAEAISAINPNVKLQTHSVKMTRYNAVELIENYDIVIDATDNILSRYMINDACIVAKKPLISGAALKMDGQLTVYNYDNETPCFRCLFPEPPLTDAVGSCSDNGVLGVIPGIIGVHQALEALKIASGLRPAYAGKMLLFDGQLGLFRHVILAKKKPDCAACSHESKLSRDLIDYDKFCGFRACQQPNQSNSILEANERITTENYKNILESSVPHVLIDVRPLAHSEVSRFEHAIQIPLMNLIQNSEESIKRIKDELKSKNTNSIYVVCRKGIASQRGVKILKELFNDEDSKLAVKDIIGGMTDWAKQIDPKYSCL